MTNYYSTTIQSKNIEFIHRVIISQALKEKENITNISKKLGFSRQTIYNEIKRGTIEKRNTDYTTSIVYDPYAAQYAHEQSSSWKGRLSLIDDYTDLIPVIEAGIKDKHSPEIIVYNIKMYERKEISHTISFKTIYNLIYSNKLSVTSKDLLYGPKKRRKPHWH